MFALYARVSTEDQALKGFSLDGQLEKLCSYCDARDWDIAGEYVDNGYSGRDVNRPAYREMLDEIAEWDALLVMKMDRVHRNSKNFMLMMETFREHDKEFVSMTESLDTSTAMGRFVMDIIQRIAQLESEQIGERVYFGMRQKAKGGQGLMGSPAPYGYEYDDGRLEAIDQELDVVEQLYERYLDGDSLDGLREWLEKRGIGTKKGGSWDKKTVSRILSNPVYCGLQQWEDILVPGEQLAAVSRETFNEVQREKHRRARRKGTNFVVSSDLNKVIL